MYWQPSMRKFGPLSDDCRYVASVIAPTTVPAVRKSEIVAGGNWHVATPLWLRVNLTGTTPRLVLNTLDPSVSIGCWTWAAQGRGTMCNSPVELLLSLKAT